MWVALASDSLDEVGLFWREIKVGEDEVEGWDLRPSPFALPPQSTHTGS